MFDNKPILLNTRPEPQNTALSHFLMKQLNCEVISFPTIEMSYFSHVKIQQQLPDKRIDYFIFTRVNAVEASASVLSQFHDTHLAIAIGHNTKITLVQQGWKNTLMPENASSEGILNLPILKTVKKKSIVIVSGSNPRGLIQSALIAKEAQITTLICYERHIAQKSMDNPLTQEQLAKVAIVIVSSVECFDYLKHILNNHLNVYSEKSRWLVFSERIKKVLAKDVSIDKIYVCEPNATAVLKACERLLR